MSSPISFVALKIGNLKDHCVPGLGHGGFSAFMEHLKPPTTQVIKSSFGQSGLQLVGQLIWQLKLQVHRRLMSSGVMGHAMTMPAIMTHLGNASLATATWQPRLKIFPQ